MKKNTLLLILSLFISVISHAQSNKILTVQLKNSSAYSVDYSLFNIRENCDPIDYPPRGTLEKGERKDIQFYYDRKIAKDHPCVMRIRLSADGFHGESINSIGYYGNQFGCISSEKLNHPILSLEHAWCAAGLNEAPFIYLDFGNA